MGKANDFKIKLNIKTKEFTNGSTGEKFSQETADGYVTYKESPILKVSGRRIKDKSYTSDDGRSFTIRKFALNFLRGEDYKDEALKEDGSAFVRIDHKKTMDGKREFRAVNTDSMYYGTKEDPRNTKGLRINTPGGEVLLKLNGIIQTKVTKDHFSDDVQRLVLEVDDKYCKNYMRDDEELAEGETHKLSNGKEIPKVGYTWTIDDDLFTESQLASLKEQFSNFGRFIEFFEPPTESSDDVEEELETAGSFN